MNKLVIDATNATLGRLCSYAAKQSLLGKEIAIVNCDGAVVSGPRKSIVHEYQEARRRGGTSLKGPNFPNSSERIVKRTIRGMLSFRQGRGLAAFKRIKCYKGVPKEFESAPKIQAGKEKSTATTSLLDICKEL